MIKFVTKVYYGSVKKWVTIKNLGARPKNKNPGARPGVKFLSLNDKVGLI